MQFKNSQKNGNYKKLQKDLKSQNNFHNFFNLQNY